MLLEIQEVLVVEHLLLVEVLLEDQQHNLHKIQENQEQIMEMLEGHIQIFLLGMPLLEVAEPERLVWEILELFLVVVMVVMGNQ
jgi:hypothetical protein